MAELRATVLVPTHHHGPTLHESVGTALAQSVPDIEVLIVGDGVSDATRDAASQLSRSDRRVRFLEFPKGPRNGEIHRHAALMGARGRIVCYLSDDDLWFPDHVAAMDELLTGEVGFAHALPLRIEPDGAIGDWSVDLALPYYRQQIIAGRNWIPLSCGAHTLEAYRRLTAGWTTTPSGWVGTDVYMWRKLLGSGVAVAGCTRPTVLVFPSPDRRGWASERRVEELGLWRKRIADPTWRGEFSGTVLAYFVGMRARERSRRGVARMLSAAARVRLLAPVLASSVRLRSAARAAVARARR